MAVRCNIMKNQNLNELLKKSTIADQNFIYNSFAKQAFTNEHHDLIVRKTAKISFDSSEEEIKETLAEIFDTTPDKIDFASIKKQINIIKDEYPLTKKIIKDYELFLKESNASKDKFEELDDIGKFIKKYDSSLILKIPNDINQVPDFILDNGNKIIGIEHTRLIDQSTQKTIGTLNKILHNTKKYLLENPETSNSLINISFRYGEEIIKNRNLSNRLSQKEVKEIGKNIAEKILEYKKSGKFVFPNYIERILINEIKFSTEINLIENYISKDNYNSSLENLIKTKESKLSSYTNKKEIDEIWLLIINSAIKSSSGFTIDNKEKIKSEFDKVLIMDNFDYNIKEIT